MNKIYKISTKHLINSAFTASCSAVIKTITLLILFICSYTVHCQDKELSELILDIAEDLAENESDPEASGVFIEQLYELLENPVRINTADESEISRLFFITEFQVKALIDHIKESGEIVSIYEIASIPGFDRQNAELISPFIVLTNVSYDFSSNKRLRNNILSNFIIKPGEKDTSHFGSPWKILSKYKFTTGRFAGGFSIEKDPGEKFITENHKLPDFFSANLVWRGNRFIKKIILGDYSASFGYGTNINSRMRMGLTLLSSGNITLRDEIRAYTSTDENNFFRGIAAEFASGNLGLNLMLSYNPLDATIENAIDSSEQYVTNFYSSGLHTTPQLILKKDAINESLFSVNINYNTSHIKFGAIYTGNHFSIPLKLQSGKPEDVFELNGTGNNIFSAYYNAITGRILVYGEASTDKNLKIAILQGLSARPAERLSLNLFYRYYAPGFNSFHANATGSNSTTSNEHGVLVNFTFETARYLFISAGFDFSTYPWLKYRCSFPSMAKRYELRIKYLPSENFSIEMIYNHRFSMNNLNEDTGIPGISEIKSQTCKGIVRFSPQENLQFTTRIDFKLAEKDDSRGMMMLQDIKYSLKKVPLTFWIRYSIFSTDDWDSRIYSYENDLLYSFSIPALSGTGSLSYLMVKWDISDIAGLRVKYRLMTIKTSNISAEERDEIKFQLRFWF